MLPPKKLFSKKIRSAPVSLPLMVNVRFKYCNFLLTAFFCCLITKIPDIWTKFRTLDQIPDRTPDFRICLEFSGRMLTSIYAYQVDYSLHLGWPNYIPQSIFCDPPTLAETSVYLIYYDTGGLPKSDTCTFSTGQNFKHWLLANSWMVNAVLRPNSLPASGLHKIVFVCHYKW